MDEIKCIKYALSKKKNLKRFLIYLFSACISLSSPVIFAYDYCGYSCWRPVIALGAGYLSPTNLGVSQNFPIQNPVTDSFYDYAPNHAAETNGLVDGFIGVEWGLTQSGALLQLGLGYNQAAEFTVKGTLTQGADVHSQAVFRYSYDVTLMQLLLEGKLLMTIAEIYHPYLFGGAGLSFVKGSSYSTSVPPFLTFTRMYANNTNTNFSYSVGAGLDIELDSTFRIGVGYRFSDYGSLKLGNAVIDTTQVSGTLSQSHIYTNEILAQVTVGFNY